MSVLDTIFGFALLLVGAVVLRFSYMLFRLAFAGASEITETSGQVEDVFVGKVKAWVGHKRVPHVSAGVSYFEDDNGGREQSEGFVSDEVIIKRVRELG